MSVNDIWTCWLHTSNKISCSSSCAYLWLSQCRDYFFNVLWIGFDLCRSLWHLISLGIFAPLREECMFRLVQNIQTHHWIFVAWKSDLAHSITLCFARFVLLWLSNLWKYYTKKKWKEVCQYLYLKLLFSENVLFLKLKLYCCLFFHVQISGITLTKSFGQNQLPNQLKTLMFSLIY